MEAGSVTCMWRGAQILLAGMLLIAASACDEDIPDDLLLPQALEHDNGLLAFPPKGFDVSEFPGGFRFQQSGMIRTPRVLEVWVGDAAPGVGADGRRRLSGGESVPYSIIRREGGMSGPEFELIAWRSHGSRWIVVSERVQSEWGEPDFVLAWALIARARIDIPVE